MAQGMKLFLSLFVQLVMHLYHLLKGRRLNKCCSGWEDSLIIFFALLRHRELEMSSREGSVQPLVLWALLITLCTALVCCWAASVPHCDTVRQYTLNGEAEKASDSFSSVQFLLSTHRKTSLWCAFLTTTAIVCTPRERLRNVGDRVPVEVELGKVFRVSPVVTGHLFGFIGVKCQVIKQSTYYFMLLQHCKNASSHHAWWHLLNTFAPKGCKGS